jgi:hypothetical protein
MRQRKKALSVDTCELSFSLEATFPLAARRRPVDVALAAGLTTAVV